VVGGEVRKGREEGRRERKRTAVIFSFLKYGFHPTLITIGHTFPSAISSFERAVWFSPGTESDGYGAVSTGRAEMLWELRGWAGQSEGMASLGWGMDVDAVEGGAGVDEEEGRDEWTRAKP